MTTDPARRVAADVLLAVDRDGAYGNLLLPRLLRERGITTRDAAFATELTYGALRLTGVLDPVIGAGAKRPADTLDPEVRAVLRLGAYQLLHTRVPAHAAVSATVELSKSLAGPKPTGLVNAVLRRVGERTWSQWADRFAPRSDVVGRIAFDRGYPRWIATAILESLGSDPAELDAALSHDRPTTHLVARPGRMSRDDLLAAAGPGAVPGALSEYAVRLEAGGDPAALLPVQDGRAAVQDEGSQLAALVVARALLDGSERWWLDMCAGPGGKAALLDGLRAAHIRLVANDVHAHRARLVRRTLGPDSATSTTHAVVVSDAAGAAWRAGRFDRVLLDAPCSGLGALRRRPEARWRKQPEDVKRLAALQHRLIDAAVERTRSGGLVAYVTCSPHRAETTDVVAAMRERRGDVEPVDVRPLLPGVPDLGAGPTVQLWPHRHGTDAMFIAVLRRRS